MMFTRQSKRVLATIFVLVLWMPLFTMIVTDRLQVSEAERRELAVFPELTYGTSLLADFPSRFETWFNDHFGLREGLVSWYNRVRVQWLGVSTSEWVFVGEDRWLYQAGSTHQADMRNTWPFTDAELQHWAEVLSEKKNSLESRGVAYLFVVTPNKHLIYPEFLPNSITLVRPDSRSRQLVSYLRRNTDVPVLDLTGDLLRAKEELRAYHKTDTHWNAWGAYNGYLGIVSYLQSGFPGLRPLNFGTSNFESEDRPGGDLADGLAMKEILREEHIVLKDSAPRCAENIGIPQDAGEDAMWRNNFATECVSGNARLLLFRDSYAIAMIPFLAETFARVDYFTASPVPLAGMIGLVEENKPDIVIEQRSSRWLRGPNG